MNITDSFILGLLIPKKQSHILLQTTGISSSAAQCAWIIDVPKIHLARYPLGSLAIYKRRTRFQPQYDIKYLDKLGIFIPISDIYMTFSLEKSESSEQQSQEYIH